MKKKQHLYTVYTVYNNNNDDNKKYEEKVRFSLFFCMLLCNH